MKSNYIIILGLLFSLSSYSQIWSYPPLAASNWSPNSSIPKDSIKSITVWNHEIVDGIDSGEKELHMIQEFDSIGNTTGIFYGHGDMVTFNKYINGFWQEKIADGKTYKRQVQFDANGNVIELVIDDFKHTVSYDSLNRPLKAINNSEEHLWHYEEENLTQYTIFKNGIISENRSYDYDTVKNTISYTSQFYDLNGQKYANPDSVSAYLNNKNEVYKLISFSHDSYGWDTLTIIFDKENNRSTYHGTSSGFQQIETIKSDKGLPICIIVSKLEGVITKKTSYEYEFKN